MKHYAGLDWGESHHDMAVVDDNGQLIGHLRHRLHELFHARALRQPAKVEAAMRHHATDLLTQLDATIASAQALWTHIDTLTEQHPHIAIYRSFPGMGPLLAARLFAELGDDPHRFLTSRNLRAFCAATADHLGQRHLSQGQPPPQGQPNPGRNRPPLGLRRANQISGCQRVL